VSDVPPTAGGAARGLSFDPRAAQHAIAFFGFLYHSKGEWAGQTFVLAPWQAFVVGSLFGWQRSDGLRRFRTAYCAVPRKNGKSTLSAGIALCLLVADGEQGAEIYSAATTRDQARIVFEARRMVGSSPALRRRVQVLINNLNVEASASRFMPLSVDASSMDGLNVHGAIIDELHAHKTRPRR
jgi:phage terminase large subunit-like protein